MKVLKLKWIVILLAATLWVACSEDENNEVKKPLGVESVQNLKSKDFGTWQYYSFEKGFDQPVGIGKTDPKTGDDAKWAKRTDWDIAFNRYKIRTNSGASGNGKGGVVILEGTDFANLKEAPKKGYEVDGKQKIIIKMPPQGPQDMPEVGMSSSISKWVVIKMQGPGNYTTTITPTLFVLKTAEGKYVKILMKNYKNAKGDNGYISFDYVYQKDGSRTF